MTGARRALAAVAVIAVLASGALATCLVLHERARAAWSEESSRIEQAGYSGERSDGLYREVDVLRGRTRAAAWATAGAICLLCAAMGAARGPRTGARKVTSRARLGATTGLDTVVVLALGAVAVAAHSVRAGSPALDDAVAIVLPALAVAICLSVTARGETPGTLATSVDHVPWPATRAPIAFLALVLTLALPVTALVALLGRGARTQLFAPHLAALGALTERR